MSESNKDGIAPNGASLIVSVRKWLERNGYPSEMQTARRFYERGFETRQSFFYATTDGVTLREVDVQAALVQDILEQQDSGKRAVASLEFSVVCECKKSSKPWVMFTRAPYIHEREDPFLRFSRVATEAGHDFIENVFLSSFEMDNFALFHQPTRVGYSMVCSHTNSEKVSDNSSDQEQKENESRTDTGRKGRDSAYQAILQVTDAAISSLDRSLTVWAQAWARSCRIVLPLVVLDGKLVECFLGPTGSIEVEPASHLVMHWERPHRNRSFTIIDVVTMESLDAYIKNVIEVFDHFRQQEGLIRQACKSA